MKKDNTKSKKKVSFMYFDIKINWNNFAILFVLIPILFGVLISFIGVEGHNLFSSSFVSERGDDVIPDRGGSHAKNLPDTDITTGFIPFAIRIILSLVGLAITCMVIYSGILFVIHFGNDEQLTKAKKMLMWSLMGLAFIAFSYAIVYAITTISWTRT